MIKTKHDVFVAVGKVLGLTPAQVSVGPHFINNKTKGLIYSCGLCCQYNK